jgi:hypothetical protein
MFTIYKISIYVCRSLLDSGLRGGGREGSYGGGGAWRGGSGSASVFGILFSSHITTKK